MFWKLEIGSTDFRTRENLERVPHRLQLGTSSWGGCGGTWIQPVMWRRSELVIWLSFLALVSKTLKFYCIKNVGVSKPISWPPENDPCCLEHGGLAILRTWIQCLLSSLFFRNELISPLWANAACDRVCYVNCSAWWLCYGMLVKHHHASVFHC